MANVNKVILIGRVGSDIEEKHTSGGVAFCNFSIATTERWKDKAGSKQEKTEWHRVSAFGHQAGFISKYVKKGDSVYIEGKLQYGKYEKDGIEIPTATIKVDQIEIASTKRGDPVERNGQAELQQAMDAAKETFTDDEIPF